MLFVFVLLLFVFVGACKQILLIDGMKHLGLFYYLIVCLVMKGIRSRFPCRVLKLEGYTISCFVRKERKWTSLLHFDLFTFNSETRWSCW